MFLIEQECVCIMYINTYIIYLYINMANKKLFQFELFQFLSHSVSVTFLKFAKKLIENCKMNLTLIAINHLQTVTIKIPLNYVRLLSTNKRVNRPKYIIFSAYLNVKCLQKSSDNCLFQT